MIDAAAAAIPSYFSESADEGAEEHTDNDPALKAKTIERRDEEMTDQKNDGDQSCKANDVAGHFQSDPRGRSMSNSTVPDLEAICPGTHELHIISLIPGESDRPEDLLAVCSFRKIGEGLRPNPFDSPQLPASKLFELAVAFFRQATKTIQVQAMLSLHGRSNPPEGPPPHTQP